MRLLYLFGYPVAHSLSPAMQNAALGALGLGYEYRLMPVLPAELEEKVGEMRNLSVAGFNVTIPHKVAIIPYLDELDETAKFVGAVNTVINIGGCLKGYNTDSIASTRVLKEVYGPLGGCQVVILGAGGAARAVACGLVPHARSITVLARDSKKAEVLARHINWQNGCEIRSGGLADTAKAIKAADILVNATPVGMHPLIDATPIEVKLIKKKLLIFDLIYNPEKTRLLEHAEAAGARTVGGLRMLVYQGAESFSLWTGRKAPVELMIGAAAAVLWGAKA